MWTKLANIQEQNSRSRYNKDLSVFFFKALSNKKRCKSCFYLTVLWILFFFVSLGTKKHPVSSFITVLGTTTIFFSMLTQL